MDDIKALEDGTIEIATYSHVIYIRRSKDHYDVDIFDKANTKDTIANDSFTTWDRIVDFIQGMTLSPQLEKWNELCPECGSKHIDYDSDNAPDFVTYLTCKDCDTTFEATREEIFWLKRDTIIKGDKEDS